MNQITDTAGFALLAGEAGFDPIEERLRANVRATIEAVFKPCSKRSWPAFSAVFATIVGMVRRRAIAMGTASGSSPGPSAPRRCGCRAPGSRMKLAR